MCGFESEAAMKKLSTSTEASPAIISVEGYDTCLPEEDIKIFNVIVRKDLQSPKSRQTCFDGAEEKALELNGTDIGGWNALVKVEPEEVEDEEAELYESSLADELYNDRRFWLALPLGDITLSSPADEVESALIKHFSSCGKITHTNIYFLTTRREAKALDLDGSVVRGFKIAVRGLATIFSNRPPPL
ncbi:hypothetical protein HID58_073381, partial [Brassica napus]